MEVINNEEEKEQKEDNKHKIEEEVIECISEPNVEIIFKKFMEVGVQVSSDFIIQKFSTFITSDSELCTATGIPSFNLLDTIEKLVETVKPSFIHLNLKLNLRETIIMTFIKLKHNMSYAMLAVLFKSCTAETCKDRIFKMLDILYICLKPAIFWPSKDNIWNNIPQCFKGFENVRVVLDCTEISIQRSKNLCCQIVTYSHYKSTYTIKFITGVTPTGFISFISKPYGGRSSDNVIFEQSEIIKLLDKQDAIMVDRGFTVGDLCKKNDIKLIASPFLKNKNNFPKQKQY